MRRAKLPKATMNALFATPPLDYEAESSERLGAFDLAARLRVPRSNHRAALSQ